MKLKIYKLILRWVSKEIAINDPSVIKESRLAKRLNINKQKIKRNKNEQLRSY